MLDRELEARARTLLGPNAYRARALESVETKLKPKVEAYRHKVEKLSGSIDLALTALGSTAVTAGVSTSAAGAAAYASTYISAQMSALAAVATGSTATAVSADALAHAAWWTASAEVASTSVAVGAAVGLGAAAFMGGMKIAAWLDDKGRYCILEEPGGRANSLDPSTSSRVYVQNLLPAPVRVCLWAAERRRRRKLRGIIERSVQAVAIASGIREDVRHSAWQLEPRGEVLSEKSIDIGAEAFLEVPSESLATSPLRISDPFGAVEPSGERAVTRYLVLSVAFPGVIFDKDLGWCKARKGRRFLVCEVDGLTRDKLVQEAGLGSNASGEELQGDVLEESDEVPVSQQGITASTQDIQSDTSDRRALTADFL